MADQNFKKVFQTYLKPRTLAEKSMYLYQYFGCSMFD